MTECGFTQKNEDDDEKKEERLTTKDLVASELEQALRITQDLAEKAGKVVGMQDGVNECGFTQYFYQSKMSTWITLFPGEGKGRCCRREEEETKEPGRELNPRQSSQKVIIPKTCGII